MELELFFKTYTGAPEWVGIVVMGITVILYCMAGGIRSIMITDVIQGIFNGSNSCSYFLCIFAIRWRS